MKILFYLSLITIFYTYIGYPVLIYMLSIFYKHPVSGKYVYPTVSILMSVYNEEKNIEEKMKTLRELDYPPARMEILIGSDGSTDRTEEILKKIGTVPLELEKNNFGGDSLCFYSKPQREGKPSVLNILAKQAKGEILVFVDARQRMDRNSIKELVKYFSDPKIGSVSGELHFEGESSQAGEGVGLYWKYEKFIRKSEAKIGSMLGATGALYAIRRELYPELPKGLILDDIYIPMHIIQKGYRAIFDGKAKIYDRYSKDAKEEFLRKTRTLAGNFQLFTYFKWLFNPFKSYIAWQFISHKFLRLLVPFLLTLFLMSNAHLLSNNFYRIFFALQIMFYAFAIFGWLFKNKNRYCDIAYMFCVMNAAAVVGLYRFLSRRQDALWQKAELT